MHDVLELVSSTRRIKGTIELPASKSISNRLLVLEKMSSGRITGIGYSNADDTFILKQALEQMPSEIHAGAGGTTIRFLLAVLASTPNYEGVLRGTVRLMERPISPLVDALRLAGAEIEYTQREGFAPLFIRGKKLKGGKIPIDPSFSSQFLSAMLLVAPAMESALELIPQGEISSAPYLQMTVQLMQQCGFEIEYSKDKIVVQPGFPKKEIQIEIERDWSAASYWYSFVALSDTASIELPGLHLNSLQGDVDCARVFSEMGVQTITTSNGIQLLKTPVTKKEFQLNCLHTPDLFQTYAVCIAGLGLKAQFTGLHSLLHKETNRLKAVVDELSKIQVHFQFLENNVLQLDASEINTNTLLIVKTYEDHRMAMAFSPLSLVLKKIAIRNSDVVSKSYPNFWSDVRKSGVLIAEWH